ncbi:hypothetical protein SO802_000512 [Lithocarpus litseifolius]|uniref:DNA-directed RNA polymerase n=1 Tax=Lithocarpus litseifolius TaxID=425828 RepID=A0AAW2DS38_9ROSI
MRKYNLLRRRLIKAETEAWERMVEEYRELEREMCEKKLAPTLPYVKALFLGWFEPLRDAIEKEQKMQRTKKHKDKMAVIVMHKMTGLFMMGNQEGYVQVVQAAIQICVAIEQEVRIHSFLEKTKNSQSKKIVADTEDGLHKEKQILRKRVNSLIRKRKLKEAQKLLQKEEFKPWGQDTQAKSADGPPDIRPAFRHKFKPVTKNPGQKIVKNYGIIECDPLILMGLDKTAKHALIPCVPMLVPPKKWKGYDIDRIIDLNVEVSLSKTCYWVCLCGCKANMLGMTRVGIYSYLLMSCVLTDLGSKDAVKNVPVKQMQKVFEALDMLGNTKWRVNRRVFSVVESIWARGGNIAGLVDCEDVPIPEKPTSEDLTEIQEWKLSWRKAKKINLERHSQRCDSELKLSVTLAALGEIFEAARGIMGWLGDCAKIRTSLQILALQREGNMVGLCHGLVFSISFLDIIFSHWRTSLLCQFQVIYFGDHLFSDLRGPSKAGWRTAAIIHELECMDEEKWQNVSLLHRWHFALSMSFGSHSTSSSNKYRWRVRNTLGPLVSSAPNEQIKKLLVDGEFAYHNAEGELDAARSSWQDGHYADVSNHVLAALKFGQDYEDFRGSQVPNETLANMIDTFEGLAIASVGVLKEL